MFRNKISKKNLLQLVGWVILFIFSILVTRIFSSDEIEIKNGFLDNLLAFTLPYFIFGILLIFLLIWNIKRENRKATTGLSSFLLLFLSILFFSIIFLLTAFPSPNKVDAIIYQNFENSNDFVIYQFSLTGITQDNPKWRVIRTEKKDASIRKIKIIENISKNEKIIGFPINDSIKQKIHIENELFKLIQFTTPNPNSNKWDLNNWSTYEITNR